MRVLSFGGGRQTTALLVLMARGEIQRPDVILFADPENEYPGTYEYISKVAQPYAKAHGMTITSVGADLRTKSYQGSLESYCLDHQMLPGTWKRWCTSHYKILPILKAQAAMGATAKQPAEVSLGISIDEKRRGVPSLVAAQVKRYPLIELNLSRYDCEQIIASDGLPLPPKSGCWFCPFKKRSEWQAMKRRQPEMFERALTLERNARPKKNGGQRYLPFFGPLEFIAQQNELPGFDEAIEAESQCVAGYCGS